MTRSPIGNAMFSRLTMRTIGNLAVTLLVAYAVTGGVFTAFTLIEVKDDIQTRAAESAASEARLRNAENDANAKQVELQRAVTNSHERLSANRAAQNDLRTANEQWQNDETELAAAEQLVKATEPDVSNSLGDVAKAGASSIPVVGSVIDCNSVFVEIRSHGMTADNLRSVARTVDDQVAKASLNAQADAHAKAAGDKIGDAWLTCGSIALDLAGIGGVSNRARKVKDAGVKLFDDIFRGGGRIADEARALATSARSKLDRSRKIAGDTRVRAEQAEEALARAKSFERSATIRAAEAEDWAVSARTVAENDRVQLNASKAKEEQLFWVPLVWPSRFF